MGEPVRKYGYESVEMLMEDKTMTARDLLFLIWYSIRDIILDMLRFLEAFKSPKTWSFILYATLFLMAYYRKLTPKNAIIIIALILVVYVVRQHKDPDFNRAVKEKAFLRNDDDKIKRYYENYKKQCYFSVPRKEPLNYEEYKHKEVKKVQESTSGIGVP